MNYILEVGDFKKDILSIEDMCNGVHYVFKFDNGYGASVIKHDYSYGHDMDRWELAVINFWMIDEPNHYDLEYNTPITDDVIGYLTDEEVRNYLQKIKEL